MIVALTALGVLGQNAGPAVPVATPAPTSNPAARAHGPRSMFPRRRSYVLPPFGPDFLDVPNYRSVGGPETINAAEAKRKRRAAKWITAMLGTAQGKFRAAERVREIAFV